jgi:hypothetical protein
MSWNPAMQQRRLTLERYLAEALFLGGLGELVPRKQRGRFAPRVALLLLFLSLLGWLGLPFAGLVLSWILAFAIESLDALRQQRGLLSWTLFRRSLWERIRPLFYWPLVLGVGFVAAWYAEASWFEVLLRVGFQWLCFRIVEDLRQQPGRYESLIRFERWRAHLWQQVSHAFRSWARLAFVGALLAVVLNLSSAALWETVGNTSWSRLLVFAVALYLIAILTFGRLSRSMARSAVSGAVAGWDGVRPNDLKTLLRSLPSVPGVIYAGANSARLVGAQVEWKDEYHLASRVGQQLAVALARRHRQNALFSSLGALVLSAFLIGTSALLIMPREVMVRWTSSGQAEESSLALALDGLADLGSGEFWDRFLDMEGLDLAREPLPKLAFLEAIILVSLIMLESSAGQIRADLDPVELRRWLTLGTTYLVLLETEFQQLYCGFLTRKLTGVGTLTTLAIRNDVLLIPAVGTKVRVYRAIGNYLRVYGQPQEGNLPFALTFFDDLASAQEWAVRFLRFPPLLRGWPADLDRREFVEEGPRPPRFWIWSDDRLVTLSSFEEARWYARLVALNHHANGVTPSRNDL